MIRLTVEEMNLLSIYHEGSKAQLMENMTAALPFMRRHINFHNFYLESNISNFAVFVSHINLDDIFANISGHWRSAYGPGQLIKAQPRRQRAVII